MNSKVASKFDHLAQYKTIGSERFYRLLLSDAVDKLTKIRDGEYRGITPEIELLDASDKYLLAFRKDGNVLNLEISNLLRRAGHKIYRLLIKSGAVKNNRFLNLIT